MLVTGGKAARDQVLLALEVDQPHVGAVADENIAVAPLERRAWDDAVPTRMAGLIDPGGDRLQPRPAILVSERNAAVHLVDIGRGVKPIGILELPMQTVSQQ